MPSDGPAGQVDADLAADLDLGGGHPGVAGPDDPVDRREAGVGQPVGEGPDRPGRRRRRRRRRPRAGRRRRAGPGSSTPSRSAGQATTTRSTPGDAGRDDGHDQRARVGRGAARDVGADAGQRGPAALDLDARARSGCASRSVAGSRRSGSRGRWPGRARGGCARSRRVARGAELGALEERGDRPGRPPPTRCVRVADGGVAAVRGRRRGSRGPPRGPRGRARRRAGRGRAGARPRLGIAGSRRRRGRGGAGAEARA